MEDKENKNFVVGKALFVGLPGRLFIFLLIIVSVGGILYKESLYTVLTSILHRGDSSHGLFVPLVSAFLIWGKFDRIKKNTPETAALPAVFMMVVGGFLFFLIPIVKFSLVLSILSYIFIVAALVLLLFGTSTFKEIVFPLFFLITMIPLPPAIYNQIAYWMGTINTVCAVAFSKTLGVPIYREEFNIYLPGLNLFVADSCSGIRYLLSYFTFSIVYAVLFKQSNLVRLFVVFSSIPLAFVAGITRLSVIFLAAHYISPVMAEHRPHVILSWFVFLFWLVLVVAVDLYVCRNRKDTNNLRGGS